MSESRYTPERIRSLHRRSATVILFPKYIAIESNEVWRGPTFRGQVGARMRLTTPRLWKAANISTSLASLRLAVTKSLR